MGRVYYQTKAEVPLGPEEQLGYNPKAGYYARDKSLAQRVIGKVKPRPKPLPPVPKPPIPPPVPRPKPAPSPRDRFVQWLRWGVAHEAEIHYEMRRPIPHHLPVGTLPLTLDCSAFITLCAQWANCPDPNGRNFDGDGYTGTMLEHCTEIQRRDAKPGDLVVFGTGAGHHVVAILELGLDFLVASHGQERGPIILPLAAEARVQPAPLTYLRFLA